MAEDKIPLVCMRLDDMTRVHPLMTRDRRCVRCGEPVGIYPSGQSILAAHGERIEIVCSRCCQPEIGLVPDTALREHFASVPNPAKAGRN